MRWARKEARDVGTNQISEEGVQLILEWNVASLRGSTGIGRIPVRPNRLWSLKQVSLAFRGTAID